ncbi:MAG TPA: pilus assembly PilX N-terminal domain-containing protein [Geobacteraceae bacterium]|nr:pilus assembly PilX N-terminal domain-containing protein [Geobacteraceae bacterium]
MKTIVKNENGMALLISIMFLIVLSVLIASLFSSSVYELYSGHRYQDSQASFFTAETGVRMAMNDSAIWGQGAAPELLATTPAGFSNSSFSSVLQEGDTRWKTPAGQSGGYTCKYYIEYLRANGVTHFYRITSEGSNNSGSVRKQIQMVVNSDF